MPGDDLRVGIQTGASGAGHLLTLSNIKTDSRMEPPAFGGCRFIFPTALGICKKLESTVCSYIKEDKDFPVRHLQFFCKL